MDTHEPSQTKTEQKPSVTWSWTRFDPSNNEDYYANITLDNGTVVRRMCTANPNEFSDGEGVIHVKGSSRVFMPDGLPLPKAGSSVYFDTEPYREVFHRMPSTLIETKSHKEDSHQQQELESMVKDKGFIKWLMTKK